MVKKVDAIATEAIRARATPGMVVMAIKNGQVVLEKGYGTHTYTGATKTKTSDLFDVASISKIAGTPPVIMHLQERDVIQLDNPLSSYLGQVKDPGKKDLTLRSILLHEAGFAPFIPYYQQLKAGDLVHQPDSTNLVCVTKKAYRRNN